MVGTHAGWSGAATLRRVTGALLRRAWRCASGSAQRGSAQACTRPASASTARTRCWCTARCGGRCVLRAARCAAAASRRIGNARAPHGVACAGLRLVVAVRLLPRGWHARAGIVVLGCMRARALLGWASWAARERHTCTRIRTAPLLRTCTGDDRQRARQRRAVEQMGCVSAMCAHRCVRRCRGWWECAMPCQRCEHRSASWLTAVSFVAAAGQLAGTCMRCVMPTYTISHGLASSRIRRTLCAVREWSGMARPLHLRSRRQA
jgi:hypothetical protein